MSYADRLRVVGADRPTQVFGGPERAWLFMKKGHILAEIQRTAGENGGVPLGQNRFSSETGISKADWCGRYWVRWSDALREAGYRPNAFASAVPEEQLLAKLLELTRELGHFPVEAELKIKARSDAEFPSHNTFRRLGSKAARAARLRTFALERGCADVADLCPPGVEAVAPPEREEDLAPDADLGFVYLLRSGRFYKVGRTNALGRRERELAIQLPEKAKLVHSIKTDDPAGIEAYWHRRFQERRKNGEWFELTPRDVSAFRRRKFM